MRFSLKRASRQLGLSLLTCLAGSAWADVSLLNVSYDVTREFYKDFNAAFIAHWKQATGETLTINQSHGGSSKQARSVVEGLEVDVITMNQANDIDLLAERGQLVPAEWADLARDGVSVVIPNPKTSGNGRYTYLAAWGSVLKSGGTSQQARELVRKVFANVPVFDGGGRAATTTVAQRGIGDALVTFESEVALIQGEFGPNFEVIYPKFTVLAENPVSVVDKVVDKKNTRKQAEAYLKYLWSEEGQTIAARHHQRPRSEKVLAQFAKDFPTVATFAVGDVFGGWKKAQQEHFNDGATYDQILTAGHK